MSGPSAKREQQERRALVSSTTTMTKAEPQSYFSRARAGLDDDSPRGRFAAAGYESGSAPTVDYPKLPAGSPWSGGADPGLEPPLGFEIDAQEPVGTYAEIEASQSNAAHIVPIIHDVQSTEVHLLPSSDGERKVVAGLSNESGDPATSTSAEARLAEILPRLAMPKPKRRKV